VKTSLCSFLQPPVASSLFGQNILLNTLFSHNLSLCSSLNVRDQATLLLLLLLLLLLSVVVVTEMAAATVVMVRLMVVLMAVVIGI
jgi:hypothetical protein